MGGGDRGGDAVAAPAVRLRGAFREFLRLEAAGGAVLLACVVIALAWANSPFRAAYDELWSTHLLIEIAGFRLEESLLHWINDGLMALFFFVVGLEIKREVVAGELAEPRKAMLPIAGALGGMLVPAAIYATINAGGPGAAGWGVPMATDIAFAVAAVSVLGSRVPASLKVFLTALAIVDDLGAILVIAVFYAHGVTWAWLGTGAVGLAICALFNRRRIRRPIPYALVGLIVWFAFLQSGVHATIAGVLVALTIPARRQIDSSEFLRRSAAILDNFKEASEFRSARLVSGAQQNALGAMEEAVEHVQTPLQRLEDALHPWVAFGVLPVFALANAGVSIEGSPTATLGHPVALGVIAGLVLGKSVGITLFAWASVRLGLAALPGDAGWLQLNGVAWLAGIGFTMSLFIAGLAFGEGELLSIAKLAILVASIVACLGGMLVLGAGGTKKGSEF
ncbi:MAG: Na+/H+ antiporter NhaA [Gemmatimonadota bacterium]